MQQRRKKTERDKENKDKIAIIVTRITFIRKSVQFVNEF